MSKRLLIAVGVFVGLSLAAESASAQVYPPGTYTGRSLGRPTVSPYLNMIVADGFAQVGQGGGYQTLVQPFIYARQASDAQAATLAQMRGQVSRGYGQAAPASPSGSGVPRFMNFTHYYGR